MLKKILAATITTVVIASSATTMLPYNVLNVDAATKLKDIHPEDYYYEAVNILTEKDIINGFDDETFRPKQEATRGQTAKVIAKALKLDGKTAADPGFKDVNKNDYYYESIAALTELGIVSGVTEDTFEPERFINRAEIAKMIVKAYKLQENKETAFIFEDVPEDEWFAGFVGTLVENNITTGTTPTTYGPQENVLRAQLATFVYRAQQKQIVENPTFLQSPSLTVWSENDNEEYKQGDVTFPVGSILQYNVNFNGATLGDFSSAAVEFYVGNEKVGTNTVKAEAIEQYSTSTGLTGLITAGPNEAEAEADPFWNIGAYTSDQKPTKVVFRFVKDGVNYQIAADYTSVELSPTITLADVPTEVIPIEAKATEDTNGLVTGFNPVDKTPINVSLEKGSVDYSNVRVVVEGLNDGIQLIAKDTANNWYNIVKTGWGPAEGFALADAITPIYVVANQPGTYTATIKLVDVTSNTVLATTTASIKAEAPVVSPAITLADVPTEVIPIEAKATEDTNGLVTGFNPADKTPINVSLEKGSVDYSNVRVVVEGLNDGIQLIAKDTANNWYNIVKTGWGPAEGFAIADATTPIYVVANQPRNLHSNYKTSGCYK